MSEPTFTLEQVQAREAALVSQTAGDILVVLEKVAQCYALAAQHVSDATERKRHDDGVAAVAWFISAARETYGVTRQAHVLGYVASCDEPGCFATSPMGATAPQSAAAAGQAGWRVELTNGGLDNVAFCPQHRGP
ncbi:hypothetical protein [Pseudactinotalea terrae]|uniref:hypothetical protein n=1 Tax=Pseudactinotalea terrae TaxID=1743262 RepID=UPI0012E1BC84|nr:hypothetical protein [Pseudactinotalea terrae]